MRRLKQGALLFGYLSCLLIFLAACTTAQTYPGPRLPPNEIATIKGAWNEYLISSVLGNILKVDGQTARGDAMGGAVEVLPGRHEIIVFLTIVGPGSSTSGIPQTFTFTAEAGHVYKVDGNWNGGDNQIWVFDDQSKEVVAGTKP